MTIAQLAIKGHATRGSEVIALLEMLGGINSYNLYGDERYGYDYYTIDVDKKIKGGAYVFGNENLASFTLEQFEEKFPYKVGDKVYNIIHNENQAITKIAWDFQENEVVYQTNNNEYVFVNYIQPYKEETMDRKYNVEEYLKIWEETERGLEVVINDKFELKEDNGKFYIIKKQPQYPKTYEECCEVLDCKANHFFTDFSYNGCDVEISDYENKIDDLLQNFRRLRYCRDAYWKIAGEQMGLGKPWESDWKNKENTKYCITTINGQVKTITTDIFNYFLVFPTFEMRNAFFENFKGLLETCKELL